jgi:hypothetical protein
VILEIKEPKAIKVSQVMMEHLVLPVPRVILVKLVRREIRDYQVLVVLKEIRANLENLGNKVSKVFQANRASRAFPERKVIRVCLEKLDKQVNKVFLVSKVNKEFPVFRDKVYPQAEALVKYWPNYLVTTMTQDGLINLTILTD